MLAVLVAFEVYGFGTSHIFAQQIWSPEGSVTRAIGSPRCTGCVDDAADISALAIRAAGGRVAGGADDDFSGAAAPVLAVAFFLISAWSLGEIGGRKLKHAATLGTAAGRWRSTFSRCRLRRGSR